MPPTLPHYTTFSRHLTGTSPGGALKGFHQISIAVLLSVCLFVEAAKAQTFVCVPPSAPVLVPLRDAIISIVSSSDTSAQTRYHLPALPARDVRIVTDEHTCRAAGRAFQAGYPEDVSVTETYRMIVIKVGADRYVASNPDFHLGGRSLTMTFNAKWELLVEIVE